MAVDAIAQHATPARRWPIFLCLGLMLVYPLYSGAIGHAVDGLSRALGEIQARVVTEAAIWSFGALVLAIAVFGEPRTLASIGLIRLTRWTPLLGVASVAVLGVLGGLASFVTYKVFHEPNHTVAQVESLVRGSLIYALFLALRAGVVEEVLYRGLAIEQLTILVRNRWLAALIASLAFAALHIVRFDVLQLIPIAVLSFGLAAIYLWRRNLWINIIAHTLIDAVSLSAVALHATNLY